MALAVVDRRKRAEVIFGLACFTLGMVATFALTYVRERHWNGAFWLVWAGFLLAYLLVRWATPGLPHGEDKDNWSKLALLGCMLGYLVSPKRRGDRRDRAGAQDPLVFLLGGLILVLMMFPGWFIGLRDGTLDGEVVTSTVGAVIGIGVAGWGAIGVIRERDSNHHDQGDAT